MSTDKANGSGPGRWVQLKKRVTSLMANASGKKPDSKASAYGDYWQYRNHKPDVAAAAKK